MTFWLLLTLVVAGTSIWVLADSVSLGVRKGCLGGGLADMGPGGWFGAMLFFWIIALPLYVHVRPRYAAMAGRPAASTAGAGTSVTAELERLAQLRAQGTVTEAEFQQLKQALLQRA